MSCRDSSHELARLDRGAAHLEQLFEGNRRGATLPDRLYERRRACSLALVLMPQVHLAEARPAEAGEAPEVVELKHAPRAEDLHPLLRKGAMAIREVVHGAEGAVGERELEAHLVLTGLDVAAHA